MSEPAPDPDLAFAETVVQAGLAKPEQVQESLRLRSQLASRGVKPLPGLGEILLKKGYLTREQFERARTLTRGGTAAGAPEGERIGKYIKTAKLGAGGMGEVWKAWDTELNRWVALKFLKGEYTDDLARFRREAQTAGALNHPNIAAVYEARENYIAMQFVEGQTLSTFPRADRKLLAELIRDAALAVHAAHEQGVIHRDLKPANIMVEGKPQPRPKTTRRMPPASRARGLRVYVMDFGLAKRTAVDSSLSHSGMVLGTPSYMSPEQARGRTHEVDARSDVYSLGATLYELLTDRPPFRDANVYDLLKKVVEVEPRPVRGRNPRVERDLETIVMKCLEKEPARRYATALDLAEDLTRYLAGEAIEAHPPSALYRLGKFASKRKGLLVVGAAGLLAVGIVSGLMVPKWVREKRARAGAERQKEVAEGEKEREREEKERAQREKAAAEVYEGAKRDLHALRLRTYRADYRMADKDFVEYRALMDRCAAQMEKTGPDAGGWWAIGRAKHVLGDWTAAMEAYEKGLKARPGDGMCLLYKARLLIERALAERFAKKQGAEEKMKEAVGLLKAGIESSGVEPIELDLARGYELVVKGESAEEYCGRMLEKWKGEDFREEFYLIRGLADPDRLVDDATEALKVRPAFADAYLWRGLAREAKAGLLAKRERFVEARIEWEGVIADFTKAIEINPKLAEAYDSRGVARQTKGDRDGAIADYTKAIEINPRDAYAYYDRGIAREAKGDHDGAIADYTKAIEIDPSFAEAYDNRGVARQANGDLDGAITDYTKAIEINPRRANGYYDRGTARRAKGDLDGAIEDYTKATEIDSRYANAYTNRGIARLTKGDLAGAIEDYTKAIEINPRDADAYTNRGIARLAKFDMDGAIADCTKAIEINPRFAQAYAVRGLTRQALAAREPARAREHLEAAAADLEKALEVAPPGWPHRALVDSSLKRVREALGRLK